MSTIFSSFSSRYCETNYRHKRDWRPILDLLECWKNAISRPTLVIKLSSITYSMGGWKVIIVSALFLRDKDRLRDWEIERAWQNFMLFIYGVIMMQYVTKIMCGVTHTLCHGWQNKMRGMVVVCYINKIFRVCFLNLENELFQTHPPTNSGKFQIFF